MSEERPWRIAGVETDARQFAEHAANEAGVAPATWIEAAIRSRTGLGAPGEAAKNPSQEDPEITRSRVLRMLRRLEYRVGEQDSKLMSALGPLATSLASLDERLRALESAAGVVPVEPRGPETDEDRSDEDWADAEDDEAYEGEEFEDEELEDEEFEDEEDGPYAADDGDLTSEDEDLDERIDDADADAFAAADEDDDGEETASGAAERRADERPPVDSGMLSRDDDLPIGFAGTIPFPGPRTPPSSPADRNTEPDEAPVPDTAPPEGVAPAAPDIPADADTPDDPRREVGRPGRDGRAEPHLGTDRPSAGQPTEASGGDEPPSTRRSARIEPLFGRDAPSDDDLREADDAVRADLHRLFDDGDRAPAQPDAPAVVHDGHERDRYEALETEIARPARRGRLAMLAVIVLLLGTAAGIGGFFYLQINDPERLASLDPRQLLQRDDPPPISPDPPPAEFAGTPEVPSGPTTTSAATASDSSTADLSTPAAETPPTVGESAVALRSDAVTDEAAPVPSALPAPEPSTDATDATAPNEPAALRQIREAALAGDPKAQNELGVRYLVGQDVPQDYGQAALWLRRAAEAGIASAQYNLGVLYDSGRGVEDDPIEALIWFHAAAEKSHGRAQLALAAAYAAGRGIERNPDEALRWLEKASNANVLEAQTSLARILSDGRKSREQLADALFWYRIADANGAPQAATEAERIASALSPEERAAVNRRVSRFLSERLARSGTATGTPSGTAGTPQGQGQPATDNIASPVPASTPQGPTGTETERPAAAPSNPARPVAASGEMPPPPADLPPAPTPAPPPPPLPGETRTTTTPQISDTAPSAPDSANLPGEDEIDPAMVSDIQRLLTTLGFDPGPADGKMGENTRAAISEYQRAFAMTPIDGMPSDDLLAHLRRVAGARR